jgi:DNA primase
MLKNKKPLFEFVIQHRISQFSLTDVASRVAAARAAAPVIAEIADPALRSGYTRMLADWVSLEVSEVASLIGEGRSNAVNQRVEGLRTSPAVTPQNPVVDKFEQQIMQVVVQSPLSFTTIQLRRMQAAGLTNSQHTQILDLVLQNLDGAADASFANLLVSIASEQLVPLIRELAVAPLPVKSDADVPKYAQGVVSGAMIKTLEREKADLLAALRRVEASGNEEQKSAIQRQLVELEDERRALMR